MIEKQIFFFLFFSGDDHGVSDVEEGWTFGLHGLRASIEEDDVVARFGGGEEGGELGVAQHLDGVPACSSAGEEIIREVVFDRAGGHFGMEILPKARNLIGRNGLVKDILDYEDALLLHGEKLCERGCKVGIFSADDGADKAGLVETG